MPPSRVADRVSAFDSEADVRILAASGTAHIDHGVSKIIMTTTGGGWMHGTAIHSSQHRHRYAHPPSSELRSAAIDAR